MCIVARAAAGVVLPNGIEINSVPVEADVFYTDVSVKYIAAKWDFFQVVSPTRLDICVWLDYTVNEG